MDEVLIRNWNYCVKPTDRVYFLGDLALGEKPALDYLTRLNGSIMHIQGNHDIDCPNTHRTHTFNASGITFRLIHDPKDSGESSDFEGWTIHGHTHNNDLRRYPFFDPIQRKINVSAEVVGYQPVSVPFLVNLIRTRSEKIATIGDC
jgi:calcineurin-like phosphoesterase family protein